jgi:hypothetical protein
MGEDGLAAVVINRGFIVWITEEHAVKARKF